MVWIEGIDTDYRADEVIRDVVSIARDWLVGIAQEPLIQQAKFAAKALGITFPLFLLWPPWYVELNRHLDRPPFALPPVRNSAGA